MQTLCVFVCFSRSRGTRAQNGETKTADMQVCAMNTGRGTAPRPMHSRDSGMSQTLGFENNALRSKRKATWQHLSLSVFELFVGFGLSAKRQSTSSILVNSNRSPSPTTFGGKRAVWECAQSQGLTWCVDSIYIYIYIYLFQAVDPPPLPPPTPPPCGGGVVGWWGGWVVGWLGCGSELV